MGLAAGIALVLLGIMLDRMTHGAPDGRVRTAAEPTRARRVAPIDAVVDNPPTGRDRSVTGGVTRRCMSRGAPAPSLRSWSWGWPSRPARAAAARAAGRVAADRRPTRSSTSRSIPWVGYEANAGVIGNLLQNELGYKVEYKELTEQVSWEGFETGEVDAIVENWGHADLAKTFITDKKVAVDAGSTGVDGIIGWFVPPWMAEKYPDITDWNNLNKYADLFKTSESGDKGQLLDGDPSFVTEDEGIIKGLDLNYKVVYAGSEAALIEAFRKAEQNKTPVIGYFYSPQWFLNEVPLVKINLPPWKEGCDYDASAPSCRRSPATTRRTPSTRSSARTSRTRPRRGAVHQELQVDRGGPEHRVQPDRQREHDPRGGGREVDRRQRGHVEGVDPGVLIG